MNKYNYLKPYYNKTRPFRNHFFKLSAKEIREGEEILGQIFPSQLKEFYIEIGEGFLVCPHHLKHNKSYVFSGTNRILWPTVAASFYQKIIEYHSNTGEKWEEPVECEGYYMAIDTVEMAQPGDLPFFEIGESSSFMVMKLNSDNPNAVWRGLSY